MLLKDWLALHYLSGVGISTFFKIQEAFPGINLFGSSLSELKALKFPESLIEKVRALDWHQIEEDLAWHHVSGNRIISYADLEYPEWLKHISSPPVVLFTQGDRGVLTTPQISVVGTRTPSARGLSYAREFSAQLGSWGLTITSGLAVGIDGASHEGALGVGGKTVAVLGSGLACIYPKVHQTLAKNIVSCGGVLISEYGPHTPPRSLHFPQRNRMVAGLSLGVLVVEATMRSGSLITARLAAEQGKEVFSIPGEISNPLSKGCHALIRQGAKLVETVEDILEELPLEVLKKGGEGKVSSAVHEKKDSFLRSEGGKNSGSPIELLLNHLRWGRLTTVDQLRERTGLSAEAISVALSSLHLWGYVRPKGGGYVRAKNKA